MVASFLRLWNLSGIPPHLAPDEVSLGYNAYSILKTGKDEYGKVLPCIFKSFGDYKPGLYIYITVPFVAILGLSDLAVRLPSALAGIFAVFLVYQIVRELFKNKRLAIIASFLLAINPWHIHFSRGAWEINLSLTLTLLGIYYFIKSLKEQKLLLLSAFFFGLTLLAYQGAKLSTAIVVLIFGILYSKKIFKFEKKILISSVLVGLVISAPILLSLFQGKAGRLEVFSVFSYHRPADYLQNILDQGNETIGSLNYYLFHSETVDFARGILSRWFNHFSGRFLFFEGDWQNFRHTAPHSGGFIFADMFLIILGFVELVRSKRKEALIVLFWLVLAPLPSVLSRDQVHAVRSFNMLIPLVLMSSFGLYSLTKKLKGKKFIILALIFVYLANYAYYLDAYFVHLPTHNSKYWQYGYREIVETVTPIQSEYETIKVQQSYAQPYIYFLFYQKYDPAKYQSKASLIESAVGDVGQVEKLDNICFEPIDWPKNRGEHGTLFVANPIGIPVADSADEELFEVIKEIKYFDGIDTAFRIVEVK